MKILTVFLLSVLLCVVNGYICPPGWSSWGDNCYYVSSRNGITRSWSQAKKICNQMQADLLSIESQDEYKWLSDQLNRITTETLISQVWWTGLTDKKVANRWVWNSTGLTMDDQTKIPWAPKHPNDHNEKECQHKICNRCALVSTMVDFVPFARKDSSVRGLVEQSCAVRNPYICKRTNMTELPSKCDYGDGWQQVGDKCWKLFSDRQMTWYDAKDHCEYVENGRLATMHSDEEHFSLLTLSSEGIYKFWIGLQVNKTGSQNGKWVDGSSLEHDIQKTFWAEGQPDFSRLTRGCVYMDNSKVNGEGWHMASCYDDKSFICQRPVGVCPPGWATFNGRCYELNVQNKMSWQGAKKYCQAQNTSLMEIDSVWEEKFLVYSRYLYKRGIDALWLGFREYLGSYQWISGRRVNSSIFVAPHDLTRGNDVCGLIYTDGDGNMTVTDNCAERYPFICEAAAVDTIIDYKHPPVDTFCEPDYFQYRGHCYRMNSDKKSWNDAIQACSNSSAQLVSITNSQEQAFLNAHTSQIYWIGLKKYGTTQNWKWQDSQAPHSYRNFLNGYNKLMKRGVNNCVMMMGRPGRYKGQWTPGVCESEWPYICEKVGTKTKATPPPPPAVDPDCGEGWVAPLEYGEGYTRLNFCYQLNKENREWAAAVSECRSKGGQLASIGSPFEQTVVERYIPYRLPGTGLWIGGSDHTKDSAWGWADDTPFSYMNWDSVRSGRLGLNRCIGMNLERKTWTADYCIIKRPYMCKKSKLGMVTITPQSLPVTTVQPRGTQKTCKDTYDLIGNSCYKFYNQSATQKVATDTCKQDGAYLACVESELEDVNEIQSGWSSKGFDKLPKWWIGLEDRDYDGAFTWQDGKPVTFLDWGRHQPADVHGITKCVMMTNQKAKWEVKSCSDIADGFICEATPTLTAATPAPVKMAKVCPPLASHMTDTACYLRAFSSFNWNTAKESCEKQSMQLAWFDDSKEAAYVQELFRSAGLRKFWLNYKNYNGSYVIGGLLVGTDQYLPPWNKDHTGNEYNNCTYMKASSGELYDDGCNTLMPFVCKSIRLDYNPIPPVRQTACPHKWNLVGDKCYKAFQNYRRPAKKSWFDARDHCRGLGGDLASLHAQYSDSDSLKEIFTNQFGQVMESEYWIGLNVLDRSKGYRWTDGSNFDMSTWDDDEPNDHRMSESCVVANVKTNYNKGPFTMKWNDKYCPTAHDYVCQVPAGTTTATLIPTTTLPTPKMMTSVQGKCNPGWLQFTNNCYKFKRVYFSWHEAKADCESEDAHLVVIHTKYENDFITSQITRTSYGHWAIGLTQFGDRKWGWVDGSPLDFALWHENEPSDHGGGENCGQMWHDRGFWNDYNCALQYTGHICQKPVNGITYPPTTTPDPAIGNCRSGFTAFGNRCFALFGIDTPLNWTDAQTKCRGFGSHYDLTSIHDSRDQAFMKVLINKMDAPVWIGFNDLSGFRKFVWSNNEPVDKTYWGAGEPWRSSSANGRCVHLVTDNDLRIGEWKANIECSQELPYICAGPLDRTLSTPPTTPQNTRCMYGYEEFDDQCYKLHTSAKSFNDAANNCYWNGKGYLVSIANAAEEAFIEVLLARATASLSDVWIGMKREEYEVNGLTIGQYEWQDRFDVKYTLWAPGQPRHVDKVPNCVSMNVTTGRWTSVECNPQVTKPFICKISKAIPPTRSPNHHYLCENPEALNYGDMCYTVHTPKYGKSWHIASSRCVMEGMSLASIHDGDVQQFLTDLIIYSEAPKPVWIGLIKSESNGWLWSDQSEMEFEQWGPGEPAKRLKRQTDVCGFLKFDNELSANYGANWTADRCYANKGWICQEPAHHLTVPTTTSTPTIPTTTVKKFCDGDSKWKFYNGFCYYVADERLSWHDSNTKCKTMSSELTSLHGQDEIDAIFEGEQLSQYIVAIGLTKLGLSNWGWTDKSLVDYVNWWENEPNNHDESERCSFMFTATRHGLYAKGRWNDQHCGTLGGYICRKPEKPRPMTMSPAIMFEKPGHCPRDWVEYDLVARIPHSIDVGGFLDSLGDIPPASTAQNVSSGMCYALFTDAPLNWTDARDDCRTKGLNSDLVVIHNAKEQAFLTSQLWELDMNIWIGLSDRFWNNHFWWSNNDRVQFTNWLEGEPDLRGSANCVEMLLHSQEPGKWRDAPCSWEQSYMCVMDKDIRISTPAPQPHNWECSKGYTYYNSACYKYYDTRLGFYDANDKCLNDNATIVSINSAYEQAFVESMLVFVDQPVWLGLEELEFSAGPNMSSGQFFWEDGWPVKYTLWDDGRPVRADSNEMKCVTINPLTGKWNDTFCYFSYPFICKQTQLSPPDIIPAQYKCNDGEMNFADKCFLIGPDGLKTWSDAHLSCMQMGMEMASFHSFEEGMEIMQLLSYNDKVGNIWLGLIRNIDGGFYWLDQTPVDWTFWSRNEPNDKRDNEACVEMVWHENGKWNDIHCSQQLNYLCEGPAVEFSTTFPTTSIRTPKTSSTKTTDTRHHVTILTQPSSRQPGSTSHLSNPTTAKPRVPVTADKQIQNTSSVPSSSAPLIVGVIVAIVVLAGVGIVVGIFLYRRAKQRGASFGGALFKTNGGGNGNVSFTNEIYNQNEADQTEDLELRFPTPKS